MGIRSIMLPMLIFSLEGIVYFNVYTFQGSIWYNLIMYSFPIPPDISWLGALNAIIWIAYIPIWIGIFLAKIIGLIGLVGTLFSIPFSMIQYFPILVWPHLILVIWLVYGIVSSIKIAGSGVESSGE